MQYKFKNNERSTLSKYFERLKWEVMAHPERNGKGESMIKDFNFTELLYYGSMDHNNFSVVPNEDYIVNLNSDDITSPRVFNFVADALALMKMNFTSAAFKGFIKTTGVFDKFEVLEGYTNPRVKYDNHLKQVLGYYNNVYIPNETGINNITSYEDYVNSFFNFLNANFKGQPITLSGFNKSYLSSILDTGLAVKLFDIPYDDDNLKRTMLMEHESYPYFKKLCLQFGFYISHNNPNIIVFDISSPAAQSLLNNRQLFNKDNIFNEYYIRTHVHDINYLYNNINIYYNNFVNENKIVVKYIYDCNRTEKIKTKRQYTALSKRPSQTQQIETYIHLRDLEEQESFTKSKIHRIKRRAHYLHKKLDISEAMSYINKEYKDQVWNRPYGWHDFTLRSKGIQPNVDRKPSNSTSNY